MTQQYSVVFTGKIADGFSREQVEANIARIFKLRPEQTSVLFGGKPVALKRGVDKEEAMKIRAALAKAGALGVIKGGEGEVSAASAAPVPAAPQAERAQPTAERSNSAAEAAKPSATDASIECPRCGHQQRFSKACGRCRMDLSLHIQRLERRARVMAVRRGNLAG